MAMRIEEVRYGLAHRLRARAPEIEAAILTRVSAVSDPAAASDPEYAHGLRATVAAAIDHGVAALERSEERTPPVPAAVLSQARLAARSGVSLDTVLRRYFAGYTLLSDFVIGEAERGGLLGGQSLQRLLRAQAALFDRLLIAVAEEYSREEIARPESAEQRRADRVRRLLAGELLNTADLAYQFEGHHIGAIAAGPGAAEALGELASLLDRSLLLVQQQEEGSVWAWLGGRRRADFEEVGRAIAASWPEDVALALGEAKQGVVGWRLSHRQARAALPIALRTTDKVVRYADVALLASMLRDELLVTSLRELYLDPLEEERDRGTVARETLQAYVAAERNVSSTAAALGVSRRTVGNRLRMIERRLGRPLPTVIAALEAALHLDALDTPGGGTPTLGRSFTRPITDW